MIKLDNMGKYVTVPVTHKHFMKNNNYYFLKKPNQRKKLVITDEALTKFGPISYVCYSKQCFKELSLGQQLCSDLNHFLGSPKLI